MTRTLAFYHRPRNGITIKSNSSFQSFNRAFPTKPLVDKTTFVPTLQSRRIAKSSPEQNKGEIYHELLSYNKQGTQELISTHEASLPSDNAANNEAKKAVCDDNAKVGDIGIFSGQQICRPSMGYTLEFNTDPRVMQNGKRSIVDMEGKKMRHWNFHPGLHSFCILPRARRKGYYRQMLKFANEKIVGFLEKHLVPIIPHSNSIRMNYQSPQAMRIFYGRNLEKVRLKEAQCEGFVVKRPIYGPLSVMKTTGQHPANGFKVYPFTPELEEIQLKIASDIRRHLPQKRWKNVKLDFNFLEIKIYLGGDIFCNDSDAPIMVGSGKLAKPLRTDSNKLVGLHNDLRFSDAGIQDPTDTANGNHPTVTLTIGSERDLTFVRMTKQREKIKFKPDTEYRTRCSRQVRAPKAHDGTLKTVKKTNSQSQLAWKHCPTHGNIVHSLQDGSIFVLLPEDEIPTRLKDTLHKTKHRAEFCQKGVSFAFVFRSVTKASFFSLSTDEWLSHLDKTYTQSVEQHLNRNKRKYQSILDNTDKGDNKEAVGRIKANIQAFMKKLD